MAIEIVAVGGGKGQGAVRAPGERRSVAGRVWSDRGAVAPHLSSHAVPVDIVLIAQNGPSRRAHLCPRPLRTLQPRPFQSNTTHLTLPLHRQAILDSARPSLRPSTLFRTAATTWTRRALGEHCPHDAARNDVV